MNATMILTRSIGQQITKRSSKHMMMRIMCGAGSNNKNKAVLFSSTRFMNTNTKKKKKKTKNQKIKKVESKSLYFWGTTTKGSIPSKEELKAGRGSTGEESKGFFSKGSSTIDSPLEIDVKDAFGIGKYEKIIIDSIYVFTVIAKVTVKQNCN